MLIYYVRRVVFLKNFFSPRGLPRKMLQFKLNFKIMRTNNTVLRYRRCSTVAPKSGLINCLSLRLDYALQVRRIYEPVLMYNVEKKMSSK